MRYKFTSPGKPPVYRSEIDTDTALRTALGDSASTTAKLMEVASGTPLTFRFRNVLVTVEKDPTKYVLLGTCHGRRIVLDTDGTWSNDIRDAREYDTVSDVRKALHADQGYADGYDTKENAADALAAQ